MQLHNVSEQVNKGLAAANFILRFNHEAKEGLFTQQRLNADGASHLRDALTDVEAMVVEQLYQPHDGLVLCPTRDDLRFGIKRTRYYEASASGKAALVEGANPDIARASAGLAEREDDVFTVALGYEVDADELAAAGMDSPVWDYVRAHDAACFQGCQEFIDEAILSGHRSGDQLLIRSMFDGKRRNINGDNYVLKGAGGGYYLRDADGAELHIYPGLSAELMANRFMQMVALLYTETKKAIRPNTVGISLRLRTLLESTVMPQTGMTVLMHCVANSPYLASPDDVIGVPGLEDKFSAKGSKIAARDAIIVYRREPGVVEARIMSARRYGIIQLPMGQLVVWAAKLTPAQWKRPAGCLVIANNYAYSES